MHLYNAFSTYGISKCALQFNSGVRSDVSFKLTSDLTPECKGAYGSCYQSIHDLTPPTHPWIYMWTGRTTTPGLPPSPSFCEQWCDIARHPGPTNLVVSSRNVMFYILSDYILGQAIIYRCYWTSVRSLLGKYWSSSFFASLLTEPKARSINLQKKNETNIFQYGPNKLVQ